MKKITLLFAFLYHFGLAQPLTQFYPGVSVSGTDFGIRLGIYNDDIIAATNSYTFMSPPSPGKVYVYNTEGGIHQTQVFYPDDADITDLFGNSIAIGNDFIAVGSPRYDTEVTDAGAVYVYQKSGEDWAFFQKITATDASEGDHFAGVKINGNYLFITASGDEGENMASIGSVYVYHFNGAEWVFSQKLNAPQSGLFWSYPFGDKVEVEGDTLVISYGSDSQYFQLATFKLNETNWEFQNVTEIGTLIETIVDWSMSDGRIYLLNNSNSGEIYFDEFSYDETVGWYNNLSRTPIQQYRDDFVYAKLHAAGNHVFLGATDYFLQVARKFPVLHFTRNGNEWEYQNSLQGTYSSLDDFFGLGMASHGNHVVIGAPREGDPLLTGRAYYLDTALANTAFEKETQVLYPNPTNHTLNISGDTVIEQAEVYSITGKLLHSQGGNTRHIAMHEFASGIYFVKISYKDAVSETFKIIKN